ncbi:hypothetical protein BSKO_01091 [Bryopsis sp. KO-2023]|nr:hypothetical protein BSKO_01091 [Bryopsis sp. KO-2023]
MVQVYAEPYLRRHYSRRTSCAYCTRVIGHLGTLVLSFVIAYNTGGFWTKTVFEVERPKVAFTYDALLVLEGSSPGEEKVWSSFPELNDLVGGKAASVNVQVANEDHNFDGVHDSVVFKAQCFGVGNVHSVKLLMQFRYQIEGAVDLRMYSLGYVHHSAAVPGASLHVDGELHFRQKQPLMKTGRYRHYDEPLLKSSGINGSILEASSQLQMEKLISSYLDRNETTLYNYLPVWKAGSAEDFLLDMKVRFPQIVTILLRPPPLHMLRMAWIQVVPIYIVLLFFLMQGEKLLFESQLVNTRVVADLQASKRTF